MEALTTKSGMLQSIRKQIHARQKQQEKYWKDELRTLKLEHIKKNTPAAFEASGGFTMKIKPYEDKTSNGLTRCIMDFLEFNAHYANRINTQGQPRIKKIPRYSIFSQKVEYSEKVTYTKSATNKGTPDIDSIINGFAVKIEVKAGEDRVSDAQTEEAEKIVRAGGLHFIAQDFPSFRNWYRQNFE